MYVGLPADRDTKNMPLRGMPAGAFTRHTPESPEKHRKVHTARSRIVSLVSPTPSVTPVRRHSSHSNDPSLAELPSNARAPPDQTGVPWTPS